MIATNLIRKIGSPGGLPPPRPPGPGASGANRGRGALRPPRPKLEGRPPSAAGPPFWNPYWRRRRLARGVWAAGAPQGSHFCGWLFCNHSSPSQ